jgi:hypothetical protein
MVSGSVKVSFPGSVFSRMDRKDVSNVFLTHGKGFGFLPSLTREVDRDGVSGEEGLEVIHVLNKNGQVKVRRERDLAQVVGFDSNLRKNTMRQKV